MALTDILKHLDLTSLTDDQKTALTTRLKKHKRDLQTALTAVDQGLEQLAQAPAPPTPPAAAPPPPPPAGPARRTSRRRSGGS